MDAPRPGPQEATTLHVRRAVRGVPASVEWIVERFTPLLLEQARYRLGGVLSGRYDPEDVVQQVWAIALPRLGDVVPRDGRYTPVLLRFLANTLLRHYGNLVEKHLGGRGIEGGAAPDAALEGAEAPVTEAIARAMRHEEAAQLLACLRGLAEADREVLVLRGIEQLPYELIARRIGCSEVAARARYSRALHRLRSILSPSLRAEMGPA